MFGPQVLEKGRKFCQNQQIFVLMKIPSKGGSLVLILKYIVCKFYGYTNVFKEEVTKNFNKKIHFYAIVFRILVAENSAIPRKLCDRSARSALTSIPQCSKTHFA